VGPNIHRRAGRSGAFNAGHDAAGRRLLRRGVGRKALVVGTTAVAASTTFVGTAYAAIVEPPAPPLEVVVFPERDFVVTEGGPAGKSLTFEIWRQGFRIGVASSEDVAPAMTTDADGLLEINHPGGLCWQGSTPDIQPGDRLVVFDNANPTDGYAVTTQGVRATSTEIVGNDVVVHGVALDDKGNPMPLSQVEQRIVNPGFRDLPAPDTMEKRDIRATTDDGNLRPDPAVRGGFIATHNLNSSVQAQAALDGQTRVLGWQKTNAAGDRMGITIWEEDELGGPGFGGCPQGQTGPSAPQLARAQDSGAKGDHITNQSANLTFSGLAGGDLAGATAEPGADADVALLVDGAQVATGVANANAVYQFAGVTLTPGTHAVRVRSTDPAASGPAFTSDVRRVTVDKAAPTMVQRQLGPTPFHLAGTGSLRALYRVNEGAKMVAKVQHVSPLRNVRNLPVRSTRSAGLVEFLWNGRNERNVDVQPGSYRLQITATDAAGNVRNETARFRVVR